MIRPQEYPPTSNETNLDVQTLSKSQAVLLDLLEGAMALSNKNTTVAVCQRHTAASSKSLAKRTRQGSWKPTNKVGLLDKGRGSHTSSVRCGHSPTVTRSTRTIKRQVMLDNTVHSSSIGLVVVAAAGCYTVACLYCTMLTRVFCHSVLGIQCQLHQVDVVLLFAHIDHVPYRLCIECAHHTNFSACFC